MRLPCKKRKKVSKLFSKTGEKVYITQTLRLNNSVFFAYAWQKCIKSHIKTLVPLQIVTHFGWFYAPFC